MLWARKNSFIIDFECWFKASSVRPCDSFFFPNISKKWKRPSKEELEIEVKSNLVELENFNFPEDTEIIAYPCEKFSRLFNKNKKDV